MILFKFEVFVCFELYLIQNKVFVSIVTTLAVMLTIPSII